MPIEFICPNADCEKKLSIDDEKAGKKVRCPKCREVVRAPLQSGDQAVTMAAEEDQQSTNSDEKTALDELDPVLEAQGKGLAGFETENEIAQGGMGKVMLLRDKGLGRPVAMKVMRSRIASSDEHRLRFLEEAQVTGQLEHPNIVPVHELGKDEEGSLFFTMKHVKGSSLRQMVDGLRLQGDEKNTGNALSISQLLTVFLKACDGMAFAHSKSVIHRDLKPDNIMVGDYGEVLVMDWGLAKVFSPGSAGSQPASSAQGTEPAGSRRGQEASREAETIMDGKTIPADTQHSNTTSIQPSPSHASSDTVHSIRTHYDEAQTMEGAIQGTPQYMPPEQAEGKIEEIDHRSDIYSLGAILYEILTLKRPFIGKTPQDILLQVVEGKLAPPQTVAPDRNIPKELSAIAMKAMSRNKGRRYQSVGELQQDINLYLDGRAVSAKEDTPIEAVTKLLKRNKGIVAAAGVAAVIIAVVIGVAFMNIGAERDKALTSEQKAKQSEQNAKQSEQKALAAMTQQRKDALAASRHFAMQAVESAKTGRIIEAERRVEDADKVAPNSPWGLYAKGRLAELAGEYEAAEKLFTSAFKIDPTQNEIKMALGRAKARGGEVTAAQELLADIDNIKEWKELLRIGKVLYKAGKWADSKKAYAKGLEKMEGAEDVERELKTKDVKDLVDEARFSMEDAKAQEACVGFLKSVRHLPPKRQGEAVIKKLKEINKAENCFNHYRWHHTDQTGRFLEVGISSCSKLRFLEPLRGFPIQRIQLSGLRNLKKIHALAGMPLKHMLLGGSAVDDISPLRGAPLEELEMMYCPVEDISPLRGMPLRWLQMANHLVSDLSPLAGMNTLKYLQIQQSRNVRDISPLKGLKLETFSFAYTSIESIAALEGMPLKRLYINATKVKDISPIKGMPLEDLALPDALAEFDALEGLELKRLLIYGSPKFTLEYVRGMPLEKLGVPFTGVVDLSPLAGMPLTWLGANETKIEDLTPLDGLPLEFLSLKETKVVDLTPLKNSRLTQCRLTQTNVEDISPLTGLKTLVELDLNFTKAKSLAGFENHPNLTSLHFRRTAITDLTPLKGCVKLAHLDFGYTKVSSIEPLRGLPLRTCNLAYTQVTDLTPLADMKKLTSLVLSNKQQLNDASKAVIEKLRARGCNVELRAPLEN